METKYFFIKTEQPQIVRYSEGETSVYSVEKVWTENESWYDRIFFGDFSDFEVISENEAFAYIEKMKHKN